MDDIIFKCIECGTDEPTKFAKVRPNLCNDENRENFIEGSILKIEFNKINFDYKK